MAVGKSGPELDRHIAQVKAGNGDQEQIEAVEEAAEQFGDRGDRAREALKSAGRR